MTRLDHISLRVLVKSNPKAKPLAELLVAEAARQGATIKDLEVAGSLAVCVYRQAMDQSPKALTEFQSEAQATLEGL